MIGTVITLPQPSKTEKDMKVKGPPPFRRNGFTANPKHLKRKMSLQNKIKRAALQAGKKPVFRFPSPCLRAAFTAYAKQPVPQGTALKPALYKINLLPLILHESKHFLSKCLQNVFK